MRITLSLIVCLMIVISCNDDVSVIESPDLNVDDVMIERSDAEFFADKISESLFNNSVESLRNTSSSLRTIDEIYPVFYNNNIAMWVINYNDDNGYIVLSSDKMKFPLLAFSNKGRCDLSNASELFDEESLIKELLLDNNVKKELPDTCNVNYRLWNDLLTCEENEEVYLEIVTDSLIDNSEHLRSMPERTFSTNRRSIAPLCNVQWGGREPYNYEMGYYYNTAGSRVRVPVDGLAVSLGHIMYSHKHPAKYKFMYMPAQSSMSNNSNLTASLFKDISKNLGMVYPPQGRDPYIPASAIQLIPDILTNKYDYSDESSIIRYNNDESSFLQVYASLMKRRPALFARTSKSRSDSYWPCEARVVDGYQEVKVKVTKKKWILGIPIYSKVYDVYKDYFHFVFPEREETGWFVQDHMSPFYSRASQNSYIKYAIINITP